MTGTRTWCRPEGADWLIEVHAQPGARRSEIVGPHGAALKIRIAAPPADGRANGALCEFLAERLGLPRGAVSLVRGESSRRKRVRVTGLAGDPGSRLVAD